MQHSSSASLHAAMNEKQRKQIEFIDQIYNKVVLKKPDDYLSSECDTLPSNKKG
jgi:hypothetical protein